MFTLVIKLILNFPSLPQLIIITIIIIFIIIVITITFMEDIYTYMPIPVAERTKACVCSRSPAEIAGSNPSEGMDVCVSCAVM